MKSFLIFIAGILFGVMIYADELKTDQINANRIALDCSSKHPQRNIQHTILFLIDKEMDVLQESRYCRSFEKVDVVMGTTKDKQLIWYSPSPFVINGYGEKILNLKELEFEYNQTWGTLSDNSLVRGKMSWSAQCNVIGWEDAIKLEKGLRC